METPKQRSSLADNPYIRDKINEIISESGNEIISESEEDAARQEELRELSSNVKAIFDELDDTEELEPGLHPDFGFKYGYALDDGWSLRLSSNDGMRAVLHIHLRDSEGELNRLATINTLYNSAVDGDGKRLSREEIQNLTALTTEVLETEA